MAQASPSDDALILLRLSGDISTKSRKTRLNFTRRLGKNLAAAMEAAGYRYRIERTWSRFYITTPHQEALDVLQRVFGVQSLSVAERHPWSSLEDLVQTGERLFRRAVDGKSYAVRARRGSDREHIPFRSHDVERELGRALLAYGREVDLDQPEVTARVELERGQACFFTSLLSGYGGLPIGVEGRALALVSGGFDSAVASWLMLKRGVLLDYLFFNLGGEGHEQGALRVMKVIAERWSYGYRPILHAVDLRPAVENLQAKSQPRYWQVVLKRLMLRAAEAIAGELGQFALVTGEAVGQVSSQTLQNLAVISEVTERPILRPLLGFNKDEIIERARQIGTFDLSAGVREYCALDARPTTQAPTAEVAANEGRLDLGLLEEAVAQRRPIDLQSLDPVRLSEAAALDIEHIPEGATVLDLRAATSFASWHYPGALRLDYLDALRKYRSFGRDRTYVVCCEVEFKSATLAARMRQAGFDAYQFKGGLKQVMRYAIDRGMTAPGLIAPAIVHE